MDDIHATTMFRSSNNLESVGWVHAASLDVHVSNVRSLPDKPPYKMPKVMAFDIEVRSSDLGMPRAYRGADTIEMISVVGQVLVACKQVVVRCLWGHGDHMPRRVRTDNVVLRAN
jgi:hypothetical protein